MRELSLKYHALTKKGTANDAFRGTHQTGKGTPGGATSECGERNRFWQLGSVNARQKVNWCSW